MQTLQILAHSLTHSLHSYYVLSKITAVGAGAFISDSCYKIDEVLRHDDAMRDNLLKLLEKILNAEI